MKVLILCKVVDNFGDIGFVYRLTRSLLLHCKDLEISVVCDNLVSFENMAKGLRTDVPLQEFCGFNVLDWNNGIECKKYFQNNFPEVILETFQCNRPLWLDEILEENEKTDRIIRLYNIEYLTAEDYASQMHLLQCVIRFKNVKKYFFMPGFYEKTAGLILDDVPIYENGNPEKKNDAGTFTVTVFSYEQDFGPVVRALKVFQEKSGKKILAKVASGRSMEPFLTSWKDEGMPFEVEKLPFLNQQDWDQIVFDADFNFIRGEDSLTRACLSGVPFLWHAYPQDENYQIVKSGAVLKKISLSQEKSKCPADKWKKFEDLFQNYNETERTEQRSQVIESGLLSAFENYDLIREVFFDFTRNLTGVGNFTEKLISTILKT